MSDRPQPPRALPEPAGEPLPGAAGADLGLRQDRGRRLRRGAGQAGGRDRLHRRDRRRCCSEAGVEVRPVEDLTGFPEILDGRVKTLHPAPARGAARGPRQPRARGDAAGARDRADRPGLREPLSRSSARSRGCDVPEEEAIENIDVGGPTMIRAAAKNHRYVAVVVRPESYDAVLDRAGGDRASSRPRPGTGSPTRRSPTPPATTPRSAAGSRAATSSSRPTGSPPGRRSWTSPTARTRTSGRRSTPSRGRARTCSRGWRSCTARPLSFNNVLDLNSARSLLRGPRGSRAA